MCNINAVVRFLCTVSEIIGILMQYFQHRISRKQIIIQGYHRSAPFCMLDVTVVVVVETVVVDEFVDDTVFPFTVIVIVVFPSGETIVLVFENGQ